MPTSSDRLKAYRDLRAQAKQAAADLAHDAGVPICHKCGELCLDGFNTLDRWPGVRCNNCAGQA